MEFKFLSSRFLLSGILVASFTSRCEAAKKSHEFVIHLPRLHSGFEYATVYSFLVRVQYITENSLHAPASMVGQGKDFYHDCSASSELRANLNSGHIPSKS